MLFWGRSVDRVRATEDDARDLDAWMNRGIIMPQGGFGDRCLVCGRLRVRGTYLEGVCDQMVSEVVVGDREEKVAAREEKKGHENQRK